MLIVIRLLARKVVSVGYMDSTIAGSVNDNINMDSTIARSVNDNINMDKYNSRVSE